MLVASPRKSSSAVHVAASIRLIAETDSTFPRARNRHDLQLRVGATAAIPPARVRGRRSRGATPRTPDPGGLRLIAWCQPFPGFCTNRVDASNLATVLIDTFRLDGPIDPPAPH
jgi:hypothetical protein